MREALEHRVFRVHNETLRFVEVSHLSFVGELGAAKGAEGLVQQRPQHRWLRPFVWPSRWLVAKDSWLACLDAATGQVRALLLVDGAWAVRAGLAETGERRGLLVETRARQRLFVRCCSEARALEWGRALRSMAAGSGLAQEQRFGAFAPVREAAETRVRWFVDGQVCQCFFKISF